VEKADEWIANLLYEFEKALCPRFLANSNHESGEPGVAMTKLWNSISKVYSVFIEEYRRQVKKLLDRSFPTDLVEMIYDFQEDKPTCLSESEEESEWDEDSFITDDSLEYSEGEISLTESGFISDGEVDENGQPYPQLDNVALWVSRLPKN
jgi:hypothetical protein